MAARSSSRGDTIGTVMDRGRRRRLSQHHDMAATWAATSSRNPDICRGCPAGGGPRTRWLHGSTSDEAPADRRHREDAGTASAQETRRCASSEPCRHCPRLLSATIEDRPRTRSCRSSRQVDAAADRAIGPRRLSQHCRRASSVGRCGYRSRRAGSNLAGSLGAPPRPLPTATPNGGRAARLGSTQRASTGCPLWSHP